MHPAAPRCEADLSTGSNPAEDVHIDALLTPVKYHEQVHVGSHQVARSGCASGHPALQAVSRKQRRPKGRLDAMRGVVTNAAEVPGECPGRLQGERHEGAVHGDELDSAPEKKMETEVEMLLAT